MRPKPLPPARASLYGEASAGAVTCSNEVISPDTDHHDSCWMVQGAVTPTLYRLAGALDTLWSSELNRASQPRPRLYVSTGE